MRENLICFFILVPSVILSSGCQVFNVGTEIRSDEQMLDISYENAKAEELCEIANRLTIAICLFTQ